MIKRTLHLEMDKKAMDAMDLMVIRLGVKDISALSRRAYSLLNVVSLEIATGSTVLVRRADGMEIPIVLEENNS